jgi:hypothetical protein
MQKKNIKNIIFLTLKAYSESFVFNRKRRVTVASVKNERFTVP